MNNTMYIGPSIRRERKQRGLSQEELAAALIELIPDKEDMSQPHISAIERGTRMPSVPLLIAIADFFQVSIDSIVGRDEYEQEPSSILYFTEEAEEVASFIDDMRPERRQDVLAIVRVIAERDKITTIDETELLQLLKQRRESLSDEDFFEWLERIRLWIQDQYRTGTGK